MRNDLSGIWGRAGWRRRPVATRRRPTPAACCPMAALDDGMGLRASPLTPKGLAQVNANKLGEGAAEPCLPHSETICSARRILPGLLRALVYGRPFQLIVLPDKVMQLFEWTRVWREIHTDGRTAAEDIGPFWYGYSVGRWQGDTLVVETNNLDARAWMDQWGSPFSEAVKVTERWRRTSRDNLEFSMTIDDPAIYTKPWTTTTRNFRLQTKDMPDGEMLEVIFAPVDEKEFNERVRNPAAGVK